MAQHSGGGRPEAYAAVTCKECMLSQQPSYQPSCGCLVCLFICTWVQRVFHSTPLLTSTASASVTHSRLRRLSTNMALVPGGSGSSAAVVDLGG